MNFDSIISGMIYCAPNEVEGWATETESFAEQKWGWNETLQNSSQKGCSRKTRIQLKILFILPV